MIRRRRRLPLFVPLATMGDIAFLLIIFFILCSSFVKDANIKVEPAASTELEELEFSSISVTIDTHGELRLQGKSGLTPEMLETAVANLLEGKEDRTVKLRIDREQPKEVYMPIIEALSRAGATLQITGIKDKSIRTIGDTQ